MPMNTTRGRSATTPQRVGNKCRRKKSGRNQNQRRGRPSHVTTPQMSIEAAVVALESGRIAPVLLYISCRSASVDDD
ncbi:hypothetical protein GWI33_009039 [Rhynchophorus ferrugineus]|uniref:Uncharacterized protein n=1 Tax=Rhynchophorus ferrugineus TaxID=354439 RepID=A0A834IB48_RHYFE|nr:hypothetical protein GWI33_009039 [Rhynchophorus ferrugineus]